jgi:DNA uptake protein ComE-like DNA-binding protein
MCNYSPWNCVNPKSLNPHRNYMRVPFTSGVCLVALGFIIVSSVACAPNQSPDQLRQKTAEATETVKRDTRAIAEGVKEGLSSKKTVDLNKASKDDLSNLPGITNQKADRIIAERPYESVHQLVTRHILSEDEYAKISDRVVVTH